MGKLSGDVLFERVSEISKEPPVLNEEYLVEACGEETAGIIVSIIKAASVIRESATQS